MEIRISVLIYVNVKLAKLIELSSSQLNLVFSRQNKKNNNSEKMRDRFCHIIVKNFPSSVLDFLELSCSSIEFSLIHLNS